MKKVKNKKLLLILIITCISTILCPICVKHNSMAIITTTIDKLFNGNESKLIEEAAKKSGFNDINLYEHIIDAYNKGIENRGTIEYYGGFNGKTNINGDTITFQDGTISYYEADETVYRYAAGNRVGVKITAPSNLTYNQYKDAKITRKNIYDNRIDIFSMVFDNVKDGENFYGSWPVITSDLKQIIIEIEWVAGNIQIFAINFEGTITLEPSPEEKEEQVESEKNTESQENEETIETNHSSVEKDIIGPSGDIENDASSDFEELANENNPTNEEVADPKSLATDPTPHHLDYKDGITSFELSTITELNAISANIVDATGLDQLTNLRTLNISNNNLATLDLSNNHQLVSLNAQYNPFTKDITLYTDTNIVENLTNLVSSVKLSPHLDYDIIIYTIEGDKAIVTYGINSEESAVPIYTITYHINYYTYENNNYIIKNDTIYSINEEFTPSLLETSDNTKYNPETNELSITNEDDQLIKIFSLVPISFTSEKYNITTSIPKQIYLGLDKLCNDFITNAILEEQADQLIIQYNNDTLFTISLITSTIESSVYDLSKNYLYTGFNPFNEEDINITNAYKEYNSENQILTIYNDETKSTLLSTYNIITIFLTNNTNINVINNYFYLTNYQLTNENLSNNITVSNATLNLEDSNLQIIIDETTIDTIPILSLTLNYKNINDDYIYTRDITSLITISDNAHDIITTTKEDNHLIVKLNNNEIINKEIITINSEYLIRDSSIFTGLEKISLEKITIRDASNINFAKEIIFDVETQTHHLIISYEDENDQVIELDRLLITSITSNYDITSAYVLTGDEPITFTYPEFITSTIKDNIVTFNIADQVLTHIYLVNITNPYQVVGDNIYTSFNTPFDENQITITNGLVKRENNSLILTLNNNEELKRLNIIEPTYHFPSSYIITDEYIYLGNDTTASLIETNDNVNLSVSNNILTITSPIEEITFPVYHISSDEYDLTLPYIYTGTNRLNLDKINASHDNLLSINNNNLEITINNTIIATYKLAYYSSKEDKYNLQDQNIYTGLNDFDISNIKYHNLDIYLNEPQTKLTINYENTELASYNILKTTYTSLKYSFTKPYIYIGQDTFDEADIEVINGTKKYDNNKLTISQNNIELISYDIISTDTSYDIAKPYLYLKTSSLSADDLVFTNATTEINNDILTIKYGDEILKTISLVKINSDKYDLNDQTIYTGLNRLNPSDISITNGKITITPTELQIKYKDEILDTYHIIESSVASELYDLTKDYIYVGSEDIDLTKISLTNAKHHIENNQLIISNHQENLKTYDIVSISSSKYDLKKKYIYTDTNTFTITDINSINATLSFDSNNNYLIVSYKNEEITRLPIITIASTKYNLTSIKIYTGLEDLDKSLITVTNGEVSLKGTKLFITYNQTILKTYDVITSTINSSDRYDLSKNYIYIVNEDIDTSKLPITNASARIENNQLIIYNDIEDLKTYSIIKLTTKYDISIGYISLGLSSLDKNLSSVTNAKIAYNSDQMQIIYNGDVIASYPILSYSIDYDITQKDIYTGLTDFQTNNISHTSFIAIKLENNTLHIINNLTNQDIITYNIKKTTYTINNPNYTDDYIYLGMNKYNDNIVTITNGKVVNDQNTLRIYSGNNKILKTYKLITIESTKNILYSDYIYTDTNTFTTNDVKVTNATSTYSNNYLVIKYDKTTIAEIPVVTIKSTKYDLTSTNIYTGLEDLDILAITVTKGEKSINREGTKLLITYNDITLKTYNIIKSNITSSYDLTKDYIYTGVNKFNPASITLENASYEISNDGKELIIKNANKILKVLKIVTISSKTYDLTSNYIYTDIQSINTSAITLTNGHLEVKDNKLYIIYDKDILKTYDIVTISSNEYDLTSTNIYTGLNDLNNSKIKVTNGSSKIDGTKLHIIYDNKVLKTYFIIKSSITSSIYNLSQSYIYTGTNKFDIKNINLTNATSTLKDNKLTISNAKGTLRTYDIVSISSSTYDLNQKYIYTDTASFDKTKVTTTAGAIEVNNNYLYVTYNNIVLASYPIITIKSNTYDLSKNYLYTKLSNFNNKKVSVTNGTSEVKDNQLIIKYGNITLKTINLISIKLDNLNVKSNTIFINSKLLYSDFIKNVSCTHSNCSIINSSDTIVTEGTIENGMTLKVSYNNTILDNFKIIVDYLEMPNITTNESLSFIDDIKAGTTSQDIVANIQTSGNVRITDSKGNKVSNNTKLGTGYKVNIALNDVAITYTVIVKGDISGDGEIDVYDVGVLYQYIRGKMKLDNCYINSGDIAGNKDGVDVYDVGILYQYIRGKIKNLE